MLSLYTYGSQPAQYFATTGIPLFYGPWGTIVQKNDQGYYTVIGGVTFPVIPNPQLAYPYVIPSYF
jgi:hypothetical protein